MPEIAVSVIIPSYNSRDTIRQCLRSLKDQKTASQFEIIVIDSSTDGTADTVARDFPDVHLYTFPTRRFPGDARNFGVSKSRGEILAFIDADCVASPHWIEEILQAHAADHAIIGGAIGNANTESYVGWAFYLCAFSLWTPGLPTGPVVEIPTCCLSMKRWAFDRFGPFLEGTYSSDSFFQWSAGRKAHAPLFVPEILVWHFNPPRVAKFLSRQAERGAHFAKIRATAERFSRVRRVIYACLSPMLPLLLFWRMTLRVLSARVYTKPFILASPLVFLGLVSWSWGECRGYLAQVESPTSASL